MNPEYDYEKHSAMLLEVMETVCYCLMTTRTLQYTYGQIDDIKFNELACGAFGLLTLSLDKIHDLISEHEYPFRKAHKNDL